MHKVNRSHQLGSECRLQPPADENSVVSPNDIDLKMVAAMSCNMNA